MEKVVLASEIHNSSSLLNVLTGRKSEQRVQPVSNSSMQKMSKYNFLFFPLTFRKVFLLTKQANKKRNSQDFVGDGKSTKSSKSFPVSQYQTL